MADLKKKNKPIKKSTRLSPLGQAMILVVFLLMIVIRWFFLSGIVGSFNYDIILLPLAAIAGGVLLYTQYRKRERQRTREANIQVAIIKDELRRGRGLEEEEQNKVNEYRLDDEAGEEPQVGLGDAR